MCNILLFIINKNVETSVVVTDHVCVYVCVCVFVCVSGCVMDKGSQNFCVRRHMRWNKL